MENVVFPNYSNSTLNVIATIIKHFNVPSSYDSVKVVEEALNKGYKNVLFMIFDGMGKDALEHNLKPGDFLLRHMIHEVTSVYPSTTTAAMTSYYTGLSPNEHGWHGWFLYFKEYGRCIDTFLDKDSYTGEKIEAESAAHRLMPYETIFDIIEKQNDKQVTCHMINPKGIKIPGNHPQNNVKSTIDMCQFIAQICEEDGSKFIFTYWDEPDNTMHGTGCYSKETNKNINSINQQIESLSKQLHDTLIIISADHGLIDIESTIYINEIPQIDELLIMPPHIEARGASFYVKSNRTADFKEQFLKRFEDDFMLLTKEEVYKNNILGFGKSHKKTDDFIGDYLAIAIGNKQIKYHTATSKEKREHKASHAGMHKNEMVVPVIMFEC